MNFTVFNDECMIIKNAIVFFASDNPFSVYYVVDPVHDVVHLTNSLVGRHCNGFGVFWKRSLAGFVLGRTVGEVLKKFIMLPVAEMSSALSVSVPASTDFTMSVLCVSCSIILASMASFLFCMIAS